MTITAQQGPAGGREAIQAALSAKTAGIVGLREATTIGAPLPVYVADKLDPQKGASADVVAAAGLVGWEYPIVGASDAGIVHLQQIPNGGLQITGVSHGWLTQRLLDAALFAQQALANDATTYEPRLLQVPSLHLKALWLYSPQQSRFVFLTNPYPASNASFQIEQDIDGRLAAARLNRAAAKGTPMAKTDDSANAGDKGLSITLALTLAAMVAVAAAVGFDKTQLHLGYSRLFYGWLAELMLVTAFLAVLGKQGAGYWSGILVDGRNRMSLSRLQIVLCTILFVATFLVVFVWNASHPGPFSLKVPPTVWVLMGLSGLSAAASPAILSAKPDAGKVPPPVPPSDPKLYVDGVVVKRRADADPEWWDLLLGDEAGNSGSIDISKVQQLLLSAAAMLAYAVAISMKIVEAKTGPIDGLPQFSDGFLTLIGASHATYLAYKGVSHSN